MSITKKIFFTSLIVLVLALLLWGVYDLSFKSPSALAPAVAKKEQAAPAPVKIQPTISAVTDEAVIAPILDPSGSLIKYFAKNSGRIFQIDLTGQNKSAVSNNTLTGLTSAVWSPDTSKVITEVTGSNGEAKFYLNDLTASTTAPIKDNVDEIAWQTNGRIVYKYYDGNNRSLNISDPDGTNWTKLADLDYHYVSVAAIPQSGLISFWNTGDSYNSTTFESVPAVAATGSRKTIFQGKFGADYLWAPDGNTVLMTNVDSRAGSKMQLATINYNGGQYNNLNISTFISKCAWSKDNKTVYYALPGSVPDSAVLPNDYNSGHFTTSDTFWKVDTTTGQSTRIIDTNQIKDKYDATNLFLNADESILFFVNKVDGQLYKISL